MSTVTGSIAGTSIEGYIRGMKRRGHLCAPGQQVTLILDPSFPIDPDPSDELILYEQGTLVFTGYVQKASRNKPTFDWIVEGMDTYQRVQQYFIPDTTIVGHDANDQPVKGYIPQSTAFWIGYLFDLCGATYSIQGSSYSVPQGVQIGLRSVHESLQDILAYSSQYAWVAPDGTIEVKRVTRNSPSHTLTDFIRFEYKHDDEWTRTTVKVYGVRSGYGSSETQTFATASVSLPTIVPDRVTAIATPMIQSNTEAQRVADYMLSELGQVTEVATGTIVGNPDIKVGQAARLIYDDFDGTDVITSQEVTWDENGYIMSITIGERCPRISGWAKAGTPIFAGTTKYGVYRSDDSGASWYEFNTGLPVGNKYVTRIAANALDEVMAIVNGSVYYSSYASTTASWSKRDSSSTGKRIAVTSGGVFGKFYSLVRNQALTQTYVNETSNSGSSWTSTTVTDDLGHTNYMGVDMSSRYGLPYVLCSSGSLFPPGFEAQINSYFHSVKIFSPYPHITTDYECASPDNYGVVYVGTPIVTQSGSAPNRSVFFRIPIAYYSLAGTKLSVPSAYQRGYGVIWRGNDIAKIIINKFKFDHGQIEGIDYAPDTIEDGHWGWIFQDGPWDGLKSDMEYVPSYLLTIPFRESKVGETFSIQYGFEMFSPVLSTFPNYDYQWILTGEERCAPEMVYEYDTINHLYGDRFCALGALAYTFT